MAKTEEEADFPRGGRELVSSAEKKRLRQEAVREATADFQAGEFSNKKKAKRDHDEDEEDGLPAFVEESVDAQNLKFVELLKFRSLSVGAKVWGAILGVQQRDLLISLPDGLRATVPYAETSDFIAKQLTNSETASKEDHASRNLPSLQALFRVGQFVNGVIIKLEETPQGTRGGTKKRIIMSLRVERLNQGLTKGSLQPGTCLPACVRDIEDHGYTIDLGIKGVSGFLKRPNGEDSSYFPGALLDVVITRASDKRLLRVTADPEKVHTVLLREEQNLTIGTLKPGALVNTKVARILSDGLQLSFLTYFTGTVNYFHIPEARESAKDWQHEYTTGQRLRARILYVDPSSKRVTFSLLPHLMACKSADLPKPGDLIEEAIVSKVDSNLGVLLSLPKGGCAFCHISDVSDERVLRLEKVLKVGQAEVARVIGSRLMDSVAVVSLKASTIEQYLVAGLQPAQIVVGEVIMVDENGMLVSISKNTKAFVANEHISDLGEKQGKNKFKVGSKVTGRILKLDPVRRKLTMTLQKSLLSSKAKPITSLQDVPVGSRAHGIVNGFAPYGMFVDFYGGTRGLVHLSEMEMEPGVSPSSIYKIGQVVKVKIISVEPDRNRIRLSIKSKKSREPAEHQVKPDIGDVVKAVVSDFRLDDAGNTIAYRLELIKDGHPAGPGFLEASHLTDHPAAVEPFQDSIQIKTVIEEVLVLEELSGSQGYFVSRKASLLDSKHNLPKTVEDVKAEEILPGYIASANDSGVFVRFLGGLTGRCGIANAADGFISDPALVFTKGQSVRAKVLQVDQGRGTFGLTLKRTAVGDTRAEFLQGYVRDLDAAYKIRAKAEQEAGESQSDYSKFPIGCTVRAIVHQIRDYGILCNMEADSALVGLVAPHQADEPVTEGCNYPSCVLDINKASGVLDLSLKKGLLGELIDKRGKKKPKKKKHPPVLPEVEDTVNGEVQIVRDGFSVVTLPDFSCMPAHVSLMDFNERLASVKPSLSSTLKLRVQELPSESNGGRIISVLAEDNKKGQDNSGKGARKLPLLSPGGLVTGKVAAVHPLNFVITLSSGHTGRAHITDVLDEVNIAEHPLSSQAVGQEVEAVVLKHKPSKTKLQNEDSLSLILSIRPSVVQAAKQAKASKAPSFSLADYQVGSTHRGFISNLLADYMLVSLTAFMTGRVSILDASSDPEKLAHLTKNFALAQPVNCRVAKVDQKKGRLDLAIVEPSGPEIIESSQAASAGPGSLLMGRVSAKSGAGLRVHLGSGHYGTVPLPETHDAWVSNALEAVAEGSFVRCRVISNMVKAIESEPRKGIKRKRIDTNESQPSSKATIQLTIKASQGGMASSPPSSLKTLDYPPNPSDLTVGSEVCGYVKNVSKAGVFVTISRDTDARIKLANLGDTFVEAPETVFPLGTCVRGRLLSVEPKLEITLRKAVQQAITGFENLKQGQIVTGKVVRVKDFGIFVRLDKEPVTGLLHKSQISDKYVRDITLMFKSDQPVTAVVLEVDAAAKKLKLGTKPSYLPGYQKEESQPDDKVTTDSASDMDKEVLEAMANLSDAGSDWRTASGDEDVDSDEDTPGDSPSADGTRKKKARHAMAEKEDSDEEVAFESGSEENQSSMMESDAEEDNLFREGTKADFLAGGVGWADDHTPSADQAVATHPNGTKPEGSSLNKRQLKKRKREEEDALQAAEMARLKGAPPQSAADYQRELLGSPNSSFLWIQYMAFLVSLGEIAKARAVAEQALQKISYREENEKFNIWVAWLNLELQHGQPVEEAAMKLFQKALSFTNQKKLYMALLNILDKAGKEALLQQTLKTVSRKYAESAKFWLKQLEYAQRKDDAAHVASLLNHAIRSLPTRKHIKILRQAALQEFRIGSPERARSTFESLLRNYPKRMDLWSIYIDQEIKQGDKSRIRSLFERAISLQIPLKKMKFLFKRYLEFEQQHGSQGGIDHVKAAAQKYVEEAMQAS